jgi:hypothetical protein
VVPHSERTLKYPFLVSSIAQRTFNQGVIRLHHVKEFDLRKNKGGKVRSYLGAYFTPDGRRRYVSAKTKTECREKLRRAMSDTDQGFVFNAGKQTVATAGYRDEVVGLCTRVRRPLGTQPRVLWRADSESKVLAVIPGQQEIVSVASSEDGGHKDFCLIYIVALGWCGSALG